MPSRPENPEDSGLSPVSVALKSGRWEYLVPIAILLTLLGYIVGYPDRINHDCALVLSCAQVLFHGGLPYVDFVDVNPPLIFYVNLVPVLLASVTGLGLPLAFSIFVFVLLLVSTLATAAFLRNSVFQFTLWTRTFILSVSLLFSLFVYAIGDFGQREHLFAVVFFSWFWCRMIRYSGGRVAPIISVPVGILVGIVACLKPHFLMIVFFVEIVALIEGKNFKVLLRPEALSLFVVGLAYGLHFLFLPAVVKEALFGRWLPLFARYYRGTDLDLPSYYAHHSLAIPAGVSLALVCVVALVAVWQRGQRSLMIELAGAAFVASVLSMWIQKKGYSYHLVPAKLSLILVVITLSIWWHEESVRREGVFRYISRRFRDVPATVVALSLFFFSLKGLVAPGGYYAWYESFEPFREAILKYTSETDQVTFFSGVHGGYPTLVQVNRLPGSRYLTGVPSVVFYRDSLRFDSAGRFLYHGVGQMPREEKQIVDDLAEDIHQRRPKLIFVNDSDSSRVCTKGFRILPYLRHVGIIGKAMSGYTLIGRVSGHLMYMRVDSGDGSSSGSRTGSRIDLSVRRAVTD